MCINVTVIVDSWRFNRVIEYALVSSYSTCEGLLHTPKLVALMRWHYQHRSKEVVMQGPVDYGGWRWIGEKFPFLKGKNGHRHARLELFMNKINSFPWKTLNTQHGQYAWWIITFLLIRLLGGGIELYVHWLLISILFDNWVAILS